MKFFGPNFETHYFCVLWSDIYGEESDTLHVAQPRGSNLGRWLSRRATGSHKVDCAFLNIFYLIVKPSIWKKKLMNLIHISPGVKKKQLLLNCRPVFQ